MAMNLMLRTKKPIWDLYRPAMESNKGGIIQNDDRHMGASSEDKMSMMKNKLMSELLICFEGFNNPDSHNMVASVGKIRFGDKNSNCFGHNASLLAGLSGGPLCPIEHLGYFVGIHFGG